MSRPQTTVPSTAKPPGIAAERGRPSTAYPAAQSSPAAAPEPVTRRKSPEARRPSSLAVGLAATSAARRTAREAPARIDAMLQRSVRRLLPGLPVHRLPEEVGMAVVPPVLLDHVDQDPSQAGRLTVRPGA